MNEKRRASKIGATVADWLCSSTVTLLFIKLGGVPGVTWLVVMAPSITFFGLVSVLIFIHGLCLLLDGKGGAE